MDTYKLRVKIGVHEFEAEGPAKDVKAQFETWKDVVTSTGGIASPAVVVEAQQPSDATTVRSLEDEGALQAIFGRDDRRKLVSLRAHPTGDHRDADAALLILYGYKRIYQQDEVLVTKLKESLAVTGLLPERIDRTLAPYVKAGYILKTGRSKGGKYRLTNTGYSLADGRAGELLAQVAH